MTTPLTDIPGDQSENESLLVGEMEDEQIGEGDKIPNSARKECKHIRLYHLYVRILLII